MLQASHCISVLLSYLTVVRCGTIQTIFKDLDIPYPSSRDYECLEDYLHCQMKE